MKKLLILFLPVVVSAQSYFPMREGAVLEYRYYNDKGRALKNEWNDERFLRFTVEKMWGDSIANVAIENEILERLAERPELSDVVNSLNYGDVTVSSRGTTTDNLQWLVGRLHRNIERMMMRNPSYQDPTAEGSTYTVELSARSFLPFSLNVGDSLPDEKFSSTLTEHITDEVRERRQRIMEERDAVAQSMNMPVAANTPPTMNVTLQAAVRDRRVAGRERVGDFDCWKITYELIEPSTIPNIPPLRIRYVDYISPEVGLVRREKMNGTGRRVDQVMVLESVR